MRGHAETGNHVVPIEFLSAQQGPYCLMSTIVERNNMPASNRPPPPGILQIKYLDNVWSNDPPNPYT